MYAGTATERRTSSTHGYWKRALRLVGIFSACLMAGTVSLAASGEDVQRGAEAALPSMERESMVRSEDASAFQQIYEDIDDAALARQFEQAEWVAQVKISGVHRMVDNALSEPGMVAIQGYVYSGVAQKVWKGEQGKLVAFRVTLAACDRKLVRGEQYLLFANSDTDGRLQVASCEAIMPGADAATLLAYLQQDSQG